MIKNFLFTYLIIISVFSISLVSQPIPSYHSRYSFLPASPAVYQEGLVGFVNPANHQFTPEFETRFLWNTDEQNVFSFNDWGIFSSFHGLGFGMLRQHINGESVSDYRISSGFGSDSWSFGAGYGWSTSSSNSLKPERLLTAATIIRPLNFLSTGITGNFSLESNTKEGIAEIGIRPLGTPKLTLFADAAMQRETNLSDAPWSGGIVFRFVPGINLYARYFDNKAFTVGLNINLGKEGVGSQIHYNSEHNHSHNSYMIRLGGLYPSEFLKLMERKKRFLPLILKGEIRYHKYIFFDDETPKFSELLKNIKGAADDPRVGAIALNLSSMKVKPEHAWEIRQELKNAQKSGKLIFIYIDYAEMTHYHLASVADVVIMDPQGNLLLSGYRLGKTYFQGTLAKLGLGFDEWRFFKYKSAAEVLSRDQMSDADREQYQYFVDDWYESVREDVCESRRLSSGQFDKLINEQVFFFPEDAIEAGLIDRKGRWSDISEIINDIEGTKMHKISADELLANSQINIHWSSQPEIAVVYGLGECDMDEGINARKLEKVFLRLAKKKSVRAVVFRVDSPGGIALASDLVAEALRKCSKEKPVIVSQGQVAGSGGYWISMYGDEIIAGPTTITGSIGVIGGWLYDKGISGKIGMRSDYVKRGEHADLGFGVRIPFTPVQIPARNLTEDERGRVESIIKNFYNDFVKKVAAARGMSESKVREIGEGRFYSGLEGVSNGLVDRIGGLFTAIAIAAEKAGLDPDQKVKIMEIPKYKGLFRRPSVSPVSVNIQNDAVIKYIRLLIDQKGYPLPMLLPDSYPDID